jgi:hypothetical protein
VRLAGRTVAATVSIVVLLILSIQAPSAALLRAGTSLSSETTVAPRRAVTGSSDSGVAWFGQASTVVAVLGVVAAGALLFIARRRSGHDDAGP